MEDSKLISDTTSDDKPLSATYLILLLGCFLVSLSIHPLVITVAYIFLCIWALLGIKHALQALALSVVIKFLNPGIYLFSAESGLLGWLVIFCAGLRILSAMSVRQLDVLLPLGFFFLIVIALTFVSSANIPISLMKIVSFTYAASAILVGFALLSRTETDGMKTWVFSLVATVAVLSIPTFFLREIGFRDDGLGFQGLLNHPQSFGIFLAPITTWLLSEFLLTPRSVTNDENLPSVSGTVSMASPEDEHISSVSNAIGRNSYATLVAAIVVVTLLTLSRTRTSMVAIILSLGAGIFVGSVLVRRRELQFAPYRAMGIIGVLSIVTIFGVTFSSTLSEIVTGFVFKHQQSSVVEGFYAARGKGIERQWDNFLSSPLTGHGFGIYPSGKTSVGITTFGGIPISAPVEKGFVATAILEETGIIGAFFFIYFLIALTRSVLRNTDIRWICLYFSCLFVNIGEAVFFSVGGIGLFFWIMIGLAYASGQTDKEEQSVSLLVTHQDENQR